MRVTPSGAHTEFTTPTPNAEPAGMTAGPDGNLWFSEFNANKIARMTPSGTITEFPVPTASAYPSWIAPGPDGNLWFTAWGDKVGRITPGGAITEHPLPTTGAHPVNITAAPDGNLWIGYMQSSALARVEPDGTVTDFPTPSGAVGAIGSGPDGATWYSAWTTDKVGRMYIGASDATLSSSSIDFGDLQTGTAGEQTVTLTNTGAHDLSLSSLTLSGASDFTLAGATTCSVSTVLADGDSCDLTVHFAPMAAGAGTAGVTIAHDGPGGRLTLALTGTGLAPASTPVPPAPTTTPPPVTSTPVPVTSTPAPATSTPRSPTVALRDVSAGARVVTLSVRCNAACSGTATLRRNGRSVGSGRFSAAAGRVVSVRVRPTADLRHQRVTIALDTRDQGGRRATATVSRSL